MGDVLLATPLARSLSQAGYAVDWLVAPGTEAILEEQEYAQQVTVVDQHTPLVQQLSFLARTWRKYDKAFVLPATDRAMLYGLAAASSTHALVDAKRRQDGWKRFLSEHWLDYTSGKHMVSLACDLGASADLQVDRSVSIGWSDEDARRVASALPWAEGAAYLHIHPFARWRYKWWRRDAWRQLIRLASEQGLGIVITASPAEAKQASELAEGFADKQVCVLAGVLNWRQLACLSGYARAYVGMDTANTHLAATGENPVIALFGPTDPRIWGPWPNGFCGENPWQASSSSGIQRQGNISLLQGRQDCIPCQLEGCDRRPDSISLCLKKMQAEWVWQEVTSRLEATASIAHEAVS